MTLTVLQAPQPIEVAAHRAAAPRSRRLALYSHDTQGLGHVRRNIALAAAIVATEPDTDVLLLTGAPEATSLPLPPRTDVVTLPTLRKDATGRYAARTLGAALGDVVALRSQILTAAATAFDPDLFIVDKVARGVDGELDGALTTVRGRGTFVVLGIREILDAPPVARREWDDAGSSAAVQDFYDEVWVYGDPSVYDVIAECGLPEEVARKVVYTGYLSRGRGADMSACGGPAPRVAPPADPYVLCMVGGGQDGLELAEAFVRAPLPSGHQGVVLTGPYMRKQARESLRRAAATRSAMRVVEFVPDAERYIARAAAVVSMAGYNSVCEVLAAGVPALLVPRTTPRTEQLLRARSLQRLGLVDVLTPDVADPRQISRWMSDAIRGGRPRGRPSIDLDGLCRVAELAAEARSASRCGADVRGLTDVAV